MTDVTPSLPPFSSDPTPSPGRVQTTTPEGAPEEPAYPDAVPAMAFPDPVSGSFPPVEGVAGADADPAPPPEVVPGSTGGPAPAPAPAAGGAPPQWSPDGRFWWDGQQWIPNPQSQAPPTAAAYPPAYGVQQPYPQTPGGPYAMAVQPKNPGLNLIASLFIPGLGSMLAGETGIGIAILLVWLISIPLIFVGIGFFTVTAAWIFGMVHAYQATVKWNLQRGIVS